MKMRHMRLSPELSVQKIESAGEEDDILWDLTTIYKGSVGKRRNSVHGPLLEHYQSDDESIVAERLVHGDQTTTITIHSLELGRQAARWVALEAYKAKKGLPFTHLMVDVPGIAVQQEWSRYTAQAEHEVHEQDMDFSIVPVPNLADDELIGWPNVQRKGPNAVSTIVTTGEDLLEAAKRLADGYEKLRSRNHDETPDRAVARSLGTVSLQHFAKVWAVAMEGTRPINAGMAVTHILDV